MADTKRKIRDLATKTTQLEKANESTIIQFLPKKNSIYTDKHYVRHDSNPRH